MAVRELGAMPNLALLYAKAALTSLNREGGQPPDVELLFRDVEVDRDHLADYQRVCGFRVSDELPATYPHVLAFPLAAELMTDPAFPFALPGLVHVANRITQHRPLDAAERLTLRVRVGELAPHERGTQFDVHSEALVRGETVWTGSSTYLRRGAGPGSGPGTPSGGSYPSGHAPVPETTAVWRLPGDTGRRYAGVSGDRNPIHLHPLLARLFGYSRPIAHGMWLKARCLAALEGRLPDHYSVEVRFRRPVQLPSTIHFASRPSGQGWDFGVYKPTSGKPHLSGSVELQR